MEFRSRPFARPNAEDAHEQFQRRVASKLREKVDEHLNPLSR
ncbi:uncharacterized protein METZ01_LOCUS237165 [marine metagenome]|uniref:Uncharacterized protein n=1 Tax=marine metagenome TaxID=408172 RepID=A0A382HCX2_9ZZZZ